MSNLTKKEKLQEIIKLCDKYQITAYEIGENTNLNTSGIGRILKGKVENPLDHTVDTIYEYIKKKLSGQLQVEESAADYGKPHTTEAYLREIRDLHVENQSYIKEIVRLQNILSRNSIEFENIFDKK